MEKHGDGVVCLTLFVPAEPQTAEVAALEMARHMGLVNPQVISRRVMHPAEGSVFEVRGVIDMPIDSALLPKKAREETLADGEIESWVRIYHAETVVFDGFHGLGDDKSAWEGQKGWV